ncbi:Alanine racemase, biosynthetic [bacterium HR39]|nr:Alanine racemase, biosynthetic [bacterium HR39]
MSSEPSFRGPARARLEVDLDALAANWHLLARTARRAETAAVVKADAYGLGMAPVASRLWREGCRTFFVAVPDEGVALRRLLPQARILVLSGVGRGEEEAFLDHALVPVLNDPGELGLWRRLARRLERVLPAALHVDTGMNRLGFRPSDFAALDHEDLAGLALRLVISHLACADEPDHPLNARQLQAFRRLAARFPAVPRSLAASAGILLGPDFHFELVRPGLALYGASPLSSGARPVLRPVVRLVAPVLQLRTIDEPGTVGYGATHAVEPGARIAIVALGYADGFPRQAGGGRASVRVAGVSCPVVGRVSMDTLAVDVSALPGDAVRPGSEVEVLAGPGAVEALADAAGTAAYEILTRLGSRFARRYLGAGEQVEDGAP